MSWAKFSDDAHESEHILAVSVPARWLWAASIIANRGYRDGRSPFMSRARAEALARHQDVALKHIKELEDGGRWEPTEGGWNIHDYEEFLPSRREEANDHEPDPVKRAAGLKSAAQRQQTGNSPATHIKEGRQQNGNPARASRVDPVPVPTPKPVEEGLSKAPPVTPQARYAAASGYDDATTELAIGMQEILGRQLSGLELIECQAALNQYAYLTPAELLDRARSHIEYCQHQDPKLPTPRTVAGFSDSWRRENDHRADAGHPKAARVQLGRTGGLTHISDLTKELQP